MKNTVIFTARRSLLLTVTIFALVAAVVILPSYFRSGAISEKAGGIFSQTGGNDGDLPNYDVRADKKAFGKIAGFRNSLNKSAAAIADTRDSFTKGEEALRMSVPSLKIVYNSDIRTPEVIAPDVQRGNALLSGASSAKRSDILVNFLSQNSNLLGASEDQINNLKVFADYTNPDGNLSFVELNQEINGVPVFRGEVKAGFTKNGEIIRVINNLAAGLNYESLSTDFRQPLDAVNAAAGHIKYEIKAEGLRYNAEVSTDLKTVFGTGDWATTAEKMYFPTEPGVAVPAWRVLIWQPANAFYVIVDAETGIMLWRKNITEHQTQAATYQVYANPNAMINVADGPAPLSPGPIDPNSGTQGTLLGRVNVTRIGNEAPYTFNNLGWITDGNNITDGNAVQAGIDRDAINGIDAPQIGIPNRVFASAWNPPPGSPAPGDDPLTPEAQRGAVIQMFYIMNWYHDEMYRLGFTEAARNFQDNNFGRGGSGADRISAQGQDNNGCQTPPCFNNANFSAPADGTRGQMQMYLWSGPNPDRDGTADADIIIHEVTHGTSNRLHGNSAGLNNDMARGMGEGWSDFYGHAMLSEPADLITGTYSTGGYSTLSLGGLGTRNYYYGIRRFPKAVMTATGGPLNRPHNPLTFKDIDAVQADLSDGAFSPAFTAANPDGVHAAGEIWSSALWEVRARYVQRLGWDIGNRRWLQFITDGMKLAPLTPTFLTERDAIISAALASGTGADVADIWAGFAIRGMGVSSSIQDSSGISLGGGGTSETRVTEAFDLPNLRQTPVFTVADSAGDNDGFPEPGEQLTLTVPLTNNTGNAALGVTLQIAGQSTFTFYGDINNGQTVSNSLISYTIPAGTACGSSIVLTFNINSSLGPASFTRTIFVGVPNLTTSQNFDAVTAPAFPTGWTAAPLQGGINFVTATTNSDTAPNSAFALDPATVGGGTNLTSPPVRVTSATATVSFRNRFDTESGWDGGVLEISLGGAPFQDILAAGGSFTQNGYNGTLGAGDNNPLAGRAAWNGNSGGYITTTAQLPASANGSYVELRWRFGADDNTVGIGPSPGWNIDGIQLTGAGFAASFTCSFTPANVRSRADFDGDGKTDLSVFRPSEGNWYLNGSTIGFTVVKFGVAGDRLVPGDYDGDGKTDIAIFRALDGPEPDFYILNSNGFTVTSLAFGSPGDAPVLGDYDGDNKADVAVFRQSNNVWYILNSSGGATISQFGIAGDLPVQADYNGDGRTDIAIYRAGQWYIAGGGAVTITSFGLASDRPVQADYDGDNKDDIAVFRPSDGVWYILRSGNGGVDFVQFGLNGDVPVPGDYDGDGKDDQAVYRGGVWYMNRSASGTAVVPFGLGSDIAVPSAYIP